MVEKPEKEQPLQMHGKNVQPRPCLTLAPAIPATFDPPSKSRDPATRSVPTLKGENRIFQIQNEPEKTPPNRGTTALTLAGILDPKNDELEPSLRSDGSKFGHALVEENEYHRPFHCQLDDFADRDGASNKEENGDYNHEATLVVAAQVVTNEDDELNLNDTHIETKIQQEFETRLKMQSQNAVVVDAVVAIKPLVGADGTLDSSNSAKAVDRKIFGLTRKVWCCLLFLLLLFGGIVIGVLVFSGQDSVNSVDLHVEIMLRYDDPSVFDNSTSPQARALEWLLNDTVSLAQENLTAKVLERYALAVFYFSTDGRNWARNLPFLSEADVCSWNQGATQLFDNERSQFGAYCQDKVSVDLIRVDEAGLVGTIPWELSYLSDLEFLQLGGNSLAGTLPTELGRLSLLRWFGLANNSLTGILPTEFGGMTNMVKILACECKLVGTLPTELGLLTAMTALDITGNMLSGTIPTELGIWKALTEFKTSHNNLFGSLPSELGQWTALTALDVSYNSLDGPLSPNLAGWNNLVTFQANGNNFVGSLPSELGQWTNIRFFSLQENGITGTLPRELGAWKNIEAFSASDNNLVGPLITDLGNWSTLRSFEVARNSLEGNLPTELGLLTSLTMLDVGFNDLNGTLPTESGRLRALRWLYMGTNYFSGILPTELGELRALVALDVGLNTFTGTLPTELSQLSALTSLLFHQNNFTGSVGDILCVDSRQWDVLEGDCDAHQVEIECTCCTNCGPS